MPHLLKSWKLGYRTLLHTWTFRAYLKIPAGGSTATLVLLTKENSSFLRAGHPLRLFRKLQEGCILQEQQGRKEAPAGLRDQPAARSAHIIQILGGPESGARAAVMTLY